MRNQLATDHFSDLDLALVLPAFIGFDRSRIVKPYETDGACYLRQYQPMRFFPQLSKSYRVMNRRLDAPPLDQDQGQTSGQRSERLLSLTPRDAEILVTLAFKIRCLQATLVATAWWSGLERGVVTATRRLQRLARNGWLNERTMFACQLPLLESPLVVWQPGGELPEFGRLAYHLQNRFTEPARATTIFWASEKTLRRFGGGHVRRPRVSEVTHDLGLASVYLTFRQHAPLRAKAWISEAKILARGTSRGVKVPDAFVVERDAVTAIEFGGEYGKSKLREFHRYCERNRQGYELW